MSIADLIKEKKTHLARYSNQNGRQGEKIILDEMNLIERPKGKGMKVFLNALKKRGIEITNTSFDALIVDNNKIDFTNETDVEKIIDTVIFIEIKTSNQKRVKADFSNYYFSLTENEINAAEQLGERYIVVLFNKLTGNQKITSISEILNISRSKSWSLSVLL